MADQTPPERPRPAYGEYATPEEVAALTNRPVPPVEARPAAAPAAPVESIDAAPAVLPRRSLFDRMLTGLLLGIGFVVTLSVTTMAFQLEEGFQVIYDSYGLGPYTPQFPLGVVGAILVVSHVGLFVFALVGAVRLTKAGKPSWTLPLIAGVGAAIVYFATMLTVMFADEKLVEAVRVATGS